MKPRNLGIGAIALVAIGTLGYTFAIPASAPARAAKTVTVTMADPGCHWFTGADGKPTTKMSAKGAAKLVNHDEATLNIKGSAGVQQAKVGKSVKLGHGTYQITMVGQHSDDNHLSLVVT